MNVTIWDLDYFYSDNKVNCFNSDAMRISSYHKQRGDKVNFVLSKEDIFRPYDIYYIFKEKENTPNPPKQFFIDTKVKWWGRAVKRRVTWKMDAAMMGCRPDYLLYPEKNTKLERSNVLRLFDNNFKFIEKRQDWENAFTSKYNLVVDKQMWAAPRDEVEKALKWLQGIKNVSFLNPIGLPKLLDDKILTDLFLKLDLHKGSQLYWGNINDIRLASEALQWLQEFYAAQPLVKVQPLPIHIDYDSHWKKKENAIRDFTEVKRLIIAAKHNQLIITLQPTKFRLQTPYYEVFEELEMWMNTSPRVSWLEWISIRYKGMKKDNIEYWAKPEWWTSMFRELLRQTYMDPEFLTLQWGEKYISENDLPWTLWQEQFKLGL